MVPVSTTALTVGCICPAGEGTNWEINALLCPYSQWSSMSDDAMSEGSSLFFRYRLNPISFVSVSSSLPYQAT